MGSRKKRRNKEACRQTIVRDKAQGAGGEKEEESQVGMERGWMDPVENLKCEGLLWEEDVTGFLSRGKRLVF